MKLEGLVEDVHLDEVLRVLAMSGRSGTLHVEGEEDGGILTLRGGRVVAARLDGDRRTVAEVLDAADILTEDLLEGLTDARRKQPLPDCFADLAVIAPDLEEEAQGALSSRLEDLSVALLSTARGRFSFDVSPEATPVPCYLGDQGVALKDGIPTDALLARAKAARRAVPTGKKGTRGGTRTRLPAVTGPVDDLILVDDDPRLLQDVSRRMADRGLKVGQAFGALDGYKLLEAQQFNRHTVAVVDLVMPRMDGRGILGGLDLIKKIKAQEPNARIILTAEVDNPDALDRAREVGVSLFVRKPPPDELSAAESVAFTDAVLGMAGLSDRAGSVDLGGELAAELGEQVSVIPKPTTGAQADLARGLEMLRDMVGPVNDPERRDEIPLMILRVASSSFSRAALFLVTDGEFVGLGGFGLDPNGRDPGKALRDTHIPLDADTVLASPLREKRSVRVPFFESEWNRYLADRLGGPVPTECYVAPVFASRHVEAVLYGDNAPDGRALGDTQVLELFLTQAGAAMERASLEKRLAIQAGLGELA